MRPGDTVAVVSPSGPPDAVRLARGVALLEGLGVRVVVGANTMARQGLPYLAGSDAARAADLQAAWCDPAVTTVFCSRGGYGAARILDLLDWNAMRAAGPKTLVGSSDVTALHHAFRVELGVATLHGPMPACTTFSDERGPEPATWASLTGALKGEPWSVAGTSMLSEARAGGVGPIAGSVTGPIAGPVAGPIAGSVAGPVAGPVAGRVAGSVAGPVAGRVSGSIAGRVAGPIAGGTCRCWRRCAGPGGSRALPEISCFWRMWGRRLTASTGCSRNSCGLGPSRECSALRSAPGRTAGTRTPFCGSGCCRSASPCWPGLPWDTALRS